MMKPFKTLSVFAVLGVAALAIFGTSTASATVLCKNNLNTTTCSEPYEAGTKPTSSLAPTTKVTLETSFKNVECSESTIEAEIENAGSSLETVSGPLTKLQFKGCNCTVAELAPGSFEIHHISGTDNGSFTSSGAEVTTLCSSIFGNVHCIYRTGSTELGTLEGGNPAQLTVKKANIPRLTTNAQCAEKASLTATYNFTAMEEAIFVSDG